MSERVLVYGAGGHGKVVADVGLSAGFEIVGFIDDDEGRRKSKILGLPVLSWTQIVSERGKYHSVSIALGVGDNAARQCCHARILSEKFTIATFIHRTAVIAPSARIGEGSVVMALAAVNPDAVIGDGCILNTGCVVEHDCVLGKYVHLSPNSGLGGAAKIGERTHVGLGAVALPGVSIGRDVRVGAGAVVHRDVRDGLTVVGVPARPKEAGR